MKLKEDIENILMDHFKTALEQDPKLKKFMYSKPTFMGSETYFNQLSHKILREIEAHDDTDCPDCHKAKRQGFTMCGDCSVD